MLPALVDDILAYACDCENATAVSAVSRRSKRLPDDLGLLRLWYWKVLHHRWISSDVKVPWDGRVRMQFRNPCAGFLMFFHEAPYVCPSEMGLCHSLRFLVIDPSDSDFYSNLGVSVRNQLLAPDMHTQALHLPDNKIGTWDVVTEFVIHWEITSSSIRLSIDDDVLCDIQQMEWWQRDWGDRNHFLSIETLPNPGCEHW